MLDTRLLALQAELNEHARTADYLGVDLQRPIRSLADGYPENTISLAGKITERLLRQLWVHHGAPGTPGGKALRDLISGCRPYIRSHRVIDALHEIQRLRNRSSHDGYPVAEEDGLLAIRRLLDILAWYTATGSGALTRHAPRLSPAAAAKAEFLAGLYLTLDYRLAQRAELSPHTAYLRFTRERGLRRDHTELLVSRDAAGAGRALAAAGGTLLQAGLARSSRYLVLDTGGGALPGPLREGWRVVTYRRFLEVFADCARHAADVAALYPPLDAPPVPIGGDLLATDPQTGELTVRAGGDARELLAGLAAGGGNLLIMGGPGSGKTTLLKRLVTAPSGGGARRYRFFFDLSLKRPGESFAAFATRVLAPYLHVEAEYVFPLFCYFTRAGSLLSALDGFDEAVTELTPEGLLALFSEVAQILSAESAVVMTSRVSFLEDSPAARRLLDGTSLMPERLAQQLHAEGVDPQRLPQFSVLRLRDDPGAGPILARQLHQLAAAQAPGRPAPEAGQDLAALLWWHLTQVTGPQLLPAAVDYFGSAFVRGVTVFPLLEVVNALGMEVFGGGPASLDRFALRALFRAADPAGTAVAFRHAAYQEMLAAEFLRTPAGRDRALAAAPHPRLTEEVRVFLRHRAHAAGLPAPEQAGECVVPAGVYLVGPGHHLMLRRLERPVRMDRFPVTVHRYQQFLDAVTRHGSATWDHPGAPPGHSHQPDPRHLPAAGYYTGPGYGGYPAVAVSWWSAWAFARFEGKRLPTSLEWEAAARGLDGRLFPWGDEVDAARVTCASAGTGQPLVTYAAWQRAREQGRLAAARPGPVDAHPANVSPSGVRELGGNVWEWTATVLAGRDEAVVCGGSFDNPYRAVQASSKAACQRQATGAMIGFRCAQDA
jgi:Sulfatase-modifying factor enzyme 1/NACHT domain